MDIKEKVQRPDAEIVADLLKLKAELWERHKGKSIMDEAVMIGLKINSCIFTGYPRRKTDGN